MKRCGVESVEEVVGHLSSMYVDKSSHGASLLSLKVRHKKVQIG